MKNLRIKHATFVALLCYCLTSTAQEIASFTLINAQEDIEIGLLENDDTIYLATLATKELSLRADISGVIGSLVFELDGKRIQTENQAPYALFGNSGADYRSWMPELRTYTITGFAYASRNGTGTLLDTYTITVTFADKVKPEIQSFILVNADTDEDIALITEGSIFNFFEIGTSNVNIRAETGPETESVIFDYQGVSNFQTENLPVYAIGGNTGSDYSPWIPDLGINTVTATAYLENRGAGIAGNPATITFEIIDEEPKIDLPVLLRINSGGQAVTFNDSIFVADVYFKGSGKSFANNAIIDILETTQDAIYTTERSTTTDLSSFRYDIPVTNGDYDVKLHFAEIYWGATGGGPGGEGKRVFGASIEGEAVLTDFDMNAEKDPMTAMVKTYSTTVSDGVLTIVFEALVNQPKVAAVEIYGEGSLVVPEEECAWSERANSSLSKVEAQSVKVNNKLYVMAGFLSGLKITPVTEVYDPELDSWSTVAPMPTAVTHMGAVAVGNEVWILGGFEGNHPGIATDKVQIYDTFTDTWSAGPPLPNPRGSGAAAYNEGKIHFFGGLLPDRVTDVGEHYILDVNDSGAGWQEAAPMPNPRNHLSAAAVNGKVYAIGGQYGHDRGVQDQNFLDEYDPETDSWKRKANLPSARSHFEPGTMVHNDKIIIVGGRRGNFFFDAVTEYDPLSNSWSELCPLPTNLLAPSAKVFGDRLIVANGGENGTCCPKNSTISLPIEPAIIEDKGISVLVYHETSGFRHTAIAAGIEMLTEFGTDLGWTVNESQSSDVFTSENLARTDVVVWLNTSGDALLSPSEQLAFETFIQNGGGFVGVHAATDTYRNRSWPWYNDLVGGIVQVAPNHTSNNTNAIMDVGGVHPAIDHLSDTWNKDEEYYYWERNGGYLYDGNINLLQVRSTGLASYDAPRPITWYKYFDGGRSFYTALGHNSADYKNDENFRTLVREAIIWAAEQSEVPEFYSKVAATKALKTDEFVVYPNPVSDRLTIEMGESSDLDQKEVFIFGLDGNLVRRKVMSIDDHEVQMGDVPTGYYMVTLKGSDKAKQQLIFVK